MHSVSSFEYASVCTCCRSLKWEHDPAVENLGRIVVSTKGDFQRIQGGTENCWSPQPSAPKAQRPVPAALLWLCVCVPGTLGQAAQSLWTCFSSVLWVCCLRQWKIKLCSYPFKKTYTLVLSRKPLQDLCLVDRKGCWCQGTNASWAQKPAETLPAPPFVGAYFGWATSSPLGQPHAAPQKRQVPYRRLSRGRESQGYPSQPEPCFACKSRLAFIW